MAYHPLLGMVITRDLRARQKLIQYNTLDDVVKLLKESSNIIVLTGAGVRPLPREPPSGECRSG